MPSAARPSSVLQFSLVTPLHRTPLAIFEQTIQSVLGQTCRNWQWCLAVANDDEPGLLRRVEELEASDPRVRVVRLATNQGISAQTNAALKAAQGECVAFLDHDDLLAASALEEFGRLLDEHPETVLAYSDEDHISADGSKRFQPIWKPDWSPEMLLGHNYICHLVVLRRDWITRLGGLRSEYDGAQDWDLLLRLSELTDKIRHLPKCLYHWRIHEGSAAGSLDAKPYAADAQRRAVAKHLRRRGLQPQVTTTANGTQRVTWPIADQPLVSIIIPSRDRPRLIRRCLEGLLGGTDYARREVIVVDHESSDPEVHEFYRRIEREEGVRVVPFQGEFNYSAACNLGARQARGDLLLFLNNDVHVVEPGWLEELVRWAQQPAIGVVGAQLLYPKGQIQHAGVVLNGEPLCGHLFRNMPPGCSTWFGSPDWYRDCLAVTGACQMIRRDVFDQLGGYDEGYQLCYSDFALCLAARGHGLRVMYTPHARLVHDECSTRGFHDPREAADAVRFAERLESSGLWRDPFFHPALSWQRGFPEPRLEPEASIEDKLRASVARLLRPRRSRSVTSDSPLLARSASEDG